MIQFMCLFFCFCFSLHHPLEEFRCIDSNEILVVFSPSYTDALTCVHLRKQRNFYLCVYVWVWVCFSGTQGRSNYRLCTGRKLPIKNGIHTQDLFPRFHVFRTPSPEQPIILLRYKVRSIANSEENEKPNTEVEAMARRSHGGGEGMVHMALGNDDVYVWNIYLKHSLSPSESSLWSWQP